MSCLKQFIVISISHQPSVIGYHPSTIINHHPPIYLHATWPCEAVDRLRDPVARLHLPVQRAEGGQGAQERLADERPHHPALFGEHVDLSTRLDNGVGVLGEGSPRLAVQVGVEGDGHLGTGGV